ncbi:MAG: hypothetical protein ACFFEF_10775 [Candidatus Thorarchaeota archaeon]
MPENTFDYYCYVCGHKNQLTMDVPIAPVILKQKIRCSNCEDTTHILVTTCSHCKENVKYFLSDIDFPEEIHRLASAYVGLIKGIKDGLGDYVDEFKVPIPKRWTAKLDCSCGKQYSAELPLPAEL